MIGGEYILIAIAAFGGGMLSAGLGYLESGSAFDPKKFGASVIRAVVAGIIFAVGYVFSDGIGIVDILIAIVGGAGIDVLGNRAAGAFLTRKE